MRIRQSLRGMVTESNLRSGPGPACATDLNHVMEPSSLFHTPQSEVGALSLCSVTP